MDGAASHSLTALPISSRKMLSKAPLYRRAHSHLLCIPVHILLRMLNNSILYTKQARISSLQGMLLMVQRLSQHHSSPLFGVLVNLADSPGLVQSRLIHLDSESRSSALLEKTFILNTHESDKLSSARTTFCLRLKHKAILIANLANFTMLEHLH